MKKEELLIGLLMFLTSKIRKVLSLIKFSSYEKRTRNMGYLLVLILLLTFSIRLALPQYVKFLLFPLLFIVMIVILFGTIKSYKNFILRFRNALFYFLFILFFIYFISFILTNDKQEVLIRDFINNIAFFSFFLILWLMIKDKTNFHLILTRYIKILPFFSLFISVLGLIKLYFQLSGYKLNLLFTEGLDYPKGSSLSVDNNFFALFCLLGIIFALPIFFKKIKFYKSLIIQMCISLLFLCIFLTTSRRGAIVSLILIFILFIFFISSYLYKKKYLINFRKNSFLLLIIIIFSSYSFYFFAYRVSTLDRKYFLLKTKLNQYETNNCLNLLMFNGRTIFNKNINFNDDENKLLNSLFDPRLPYSGWASGNYELINKLDGENASILPLEAKGALINNKINSYSKNGNAYYSSLLFSEEFRNKTKYIVSLYCYVSPDFNGDWVRIKTEGDKIKGVSCYYDTLKKGTWQKLQISFSGDTGRFVTFFYLSKYNCISLDSLHGFVIFAYPELKSFPCDSIQRSVYNSKNIEQLGKKQIEFNQCSSALIIKASLFSDILGFFTDNSKINYYNKDSTLHIGFYKTKTTDHFSGPRIDRWRYAVYLYQHEYKWWQKIIGGGFGYTRKFAKEFNDPDEYDYPHNPFLGVLLYSGILGLLAYIWFLYKAVYYYWIYRKEYWTLGLAFCASFFFAFFSANTPFDPAIMGILTILPYFVHYYTLKEQNADNE